LAKRAQNWVHELFYIIPRRKREREQQLCFMKNRREQNENARLDVQRIKKVKFNRIIENQEASVDKKEQKMGSIKLSVFNRK